MNIYAEICGAAAAMTDGMHERLVQLGIRKSRTLAAADELGIDRVRFAGRLYEPDPEGSLTLILAVLSKIGADYDLVAVDPRNPARFATRRGVAWCLGEENICRATWTGQSLVLHPNILDWLRADQAGAVILDWSPAWHELAVREIVVADPDFAREVRKRIRPPEPSVPRVVVKTNLIAA